MTCPENITLTRVLNPIDRSDRDLVLVPWRKGLTIADVRRDLPAQVEFAISVNGQVVEDTFALSHLDHIVCVPVLHGGDGKNIGMLIAMLVVAAFAAWAAPALVAAMGGQVAGFTGAMAGGVGTWAATSAGASFAIGLVGSGLMVAGGLMVSAVFGPKVKGADAIDTTNSQTYSWNPSTIQQQNQPIARLYGTVRTYGNVIGAYLRPDGKQQYLYALISLGLGPINSVKRIWINDQPQLQPDGTPTYKNVTFKCRPGTNYQDSIPYFNQTKLERAVNVKVTQTTPYTYTTPGNSLDGIEVEIAAPAGIFQYNDQGQIGSYSVDVRVEIKRTGDSVWHNISLSGDTYNQLRRVGWWAGYWQDASTGDMRGWVDVAQGSTTRADHIEGEAYSNDPTIFWHWFDGELVYVQMSSRDYSTLTSDAASAYRKIFSATNLLAGQYQVRVTRISADSDDTKIGDDIYLSYVREITAADLTYPRLALVGLEGLATDQLSGSLRFSTEAEGALIRVYDGTNWTIEYNNNPAWVMLDILTQPVIVETVTTETVDAINRWTGTTSITTTVPTGAWTVARYDGIDPDKINISAFLEMAAYCDELVPDGKGGTEPRFTFNGVFDTEMNMWEAALAVGAECFAVPVWTGSRLTLIIDKPSDPIQLFTVGNTGIDSFSEKFLPQADRASEIEVTYKNAAADYNQTKCTIINNNIPTTVNKVSMQLVGTTSESQAWRVANRKLAYNQYLTRTISWQADIDAIACQVGDVVLLQNDVPQWGFGGRLVSATSNTVTLDTPVTIESGTYKVMVRTVDGSIQERTVTTTAGTGLTTLTVGTAFSPTPAQYDVWAFGPSDLEAKPVKITDIQRAGDFSVTLTGIDYYPEVYDTDSGVPDINLTNYSSLALYPLADYISAAVTWALDNSGNLSRSIDISWVASGATATKWEVYYRVYGGSWQLGANTITTRAIISNILPVTIYEIRIIGIDTSGNRTPDGSASIYSITSGATIAPGTIATLTASTLDRWIKLTWSASVALNLSGYELREGTVGSTWATATTIATVSAGTTEYLWQPNVTGVMVFFIRAIAADGTVSAVTQSNTLSLSPPYFPNGATILPEVIDNNVLLRWTAAVKGDYPVDHYEVRKGLDYASAEVIGTKSGTFTSVFETSGGTYKYWIAAVDTAGVYSVSPLSVYATVSQPPDYALQDVHTFDWSGTKTNCVIDNGSLVALVNPTETWQTHYTGNSWTTPQNQIDAGYPVYIQPGLTTASYEETIDYGAPIASTKITMDITRVTVVGTVTITPKISIKLNAGDAWTDYNDTYYVYATNFRYVKYRMDFATSNHGIMQIDTARATLAMKQKTFEGTVAAVSTDSGGTAVSITGQFIDVSSIQLTPLGTSSAVAVYDFVDTPNPTSFKVLLFNSGGTRISGTVSYLVRGV